ncbi:hypothetical protein VNI00_013506 [Paramarasmius palmivorus]|uniref:Uncharacterized protein n=1 Tax=Paramarasmius palmivorus TaxID=297713 RepID=A0AAW0BYC8_9AGAR
MSSRQYDDAEFWNIADIQEALTLAQDLNVRLKASDRKLSRLVSENYSLQWEVHALQEGNDALRNDLNQYHLSENDIQRFRGTIGEVLRLLRRQEKMFDASFAGIREEIHALKNLVHHWSIVTTVHASTIQNLRRHHRELQDQGDAVPLQLKRHWKRLDEVAYELVIIKQNNERDARYLESLSQQIENLELSVNHVYAGESL